ncbi:hypothetical protein XA68_13429 [Ophiocordyceps unilateralis]|uniref:Uncharacterized protein n=1 Tax=Ophiocordyceps unilateralis TaxID=268505 RepID=A0A2A9PCS8_OPHUN|nr:hypothetical protein XA68_13429 [Ophiocordyceps unilateralis]
MAPNQGSGSRRCHGNWHGLASTRHSASCENFPPPPPFSDGDESLRLAPVSRSPAPNPFPFRLAYCLGPGLSLSEKKPDSLIDGASDPEQGQDAAERGEPAFSLRIVHDGHSTKSLSLGRRTRHSTKVAAQYEPKWAAVHFLMRLSCPGLPGPSFFLFASFCLLIEP